MLTARNDGDVDKAFARRGQDLRGDLRDAVSVAFADGADECDRPSAGRPARCLGRNAGRARRDRGGGQGFRPRSRSRSMSTTPSSAAASAAATRNDEVEQAIAIAKAVKRPVKLIWTREEDTRQDKFRPHAVVALQGRHRTPTACRPPGRCGSSPRRSSTRSAGKLPPNKVEPQAVAGSGRQRLQRPEHARRVADQEHASAGVVLARARRNQHVFAIESFLDEMADGERDRSLSDAAQAARRASPTG